MAQAYWLCDNAHRELSPRSINVVSRCAASSIYGTQIWLKLRVRLLQSNVLISN